MTSSVDIINIYYFIIRILDKKRLGQVDIVFDYSVYLDAHQP